jgi:RNA polymerase sigma factor (sigma-70 family)
MRSRHDLRRAERAACPALYPGLQGFMATRPGGWLYPAAGPNGERRCGLLSVAVPARPLPDDMQHLLSELGWLRRLAVRLARDESDAVQETWLAALRVPPDADRPAKPWLMSVLRHVFHRRSRTERRRQAREDAAHVFASQAHGSAGEAWERLELHRVIAELVSSLDEPYRSTIVWRFFEGFSAVEVAREAGVPEGTVRWRTSEGLRRLRGLLDQRFGLAASWRPLVLGVSGGPSAGATASAETTAIWKGALSMKLGSKPAIGILLLVMLTGTAALMLSRGGPRGVDTVLQPRASLRPLPDHRPASGTGGSEATIRKAESLLPPRFAVSSQDSDNQRSQSTPPASPIRSRPPPAIPLDRRYDFTQAELDALARNCELRADLPGVRTVNDVPMGWLEDRDLVSAGPGPGELPLVREALRGYRDALNELGQRWYIEVTADPDGARGLDFIDFSNPDHPGIQRLGTHRT